MHEEVTISTQFLYNFQVLLVGSLTNDSAKDEEESEGSFRTIYVTSTTILRYLPMYGI